MKHLLVCSLIAFVATSAQAQTPASPSRISGKITYEGMRRVDLSQVRMVINGQEVRPRAEATGSPGAPDAPEGMPEVTSFTQKLLFSGTMAKEERDRPQNMMMRRTMGGPGGDGAGPARNVNMTPPFEQTTFLDLANRQSIEVMTMKKDSATQTYRTDRSLPKLDGWQLSDKTKKIAGYVCHKATVTGKIPQRGGRNRRSDSLATKPASAPEETYTIWYTTDLPFTYSPVARLTPEKGVVLQIESDSESFKATNVSMEAVDEAAVQPPKDAKTVSADDMNQLRRKAMADFRQKMMSSGGFPARN